MFCLLHLFQRKMFSEKHFLKSDLFSLVWLQSWKWLYNIFCWLVCTEKLLICFAIPNNCWTKTLLHKSRSKWEKISYFLGHWGCLNGEKKTPHLESTWKIMWENNWLEKDSHLENVINQSMQRERGQREIS